MTDRAELYPLIGQVVTLRGELANTRIPALLGVDVEVGTATPGETAEATGLLDGEIVTQREIDDRIAASGQYAHRGPGTFLRLVALDGRGLATARPAR